MQIPIEFINAISDTFYDKDIEIWTTGTIKDNIGCVIGNGKLDMIDNLKGNFQFSTREKVKQEYGNEIQANVIITCAKTTAQIGNTAVYMGVDYTIKSIITSDSHVTMLVEGGV